MAEDLLGGEADHPAHLGAALQAVEAVQVTGVRVRGAAEGVPLHLDPIGRQLQVLKHELALADSPVGLYEAISELPVRQYTVIVLRYLLGYPTARIARYMSLDDRTVNYHCRRARERLGRQLGMSVRTRVKQGDGGGQ